MEPSMTTFEKHAVGRLIRVSAFACATSLLLAACGSAADSGDDDDDPAQGGSAGSAGSAGSGPTGGTAGAGAGTSGAGPSGGTAGSTPTGGTGQGGSAGMPAGMDIWVGPSGVDSNPGTEASPVGTLNRANELARPGSTIWVLSGTFNYGSTMDLSRSGNAQSPIRLWAVAGARPVLEYMTQARASSARGIELSGSYWHIRGLEIRNAGDNGISISGSNNTIENVITHHNGDSGIQITVSEGQAADATLGASNTILNCDSYENFDTVTNGENADGFAAKLRIGAGNVFRGCRAWNNADDGYDFFAADDVVLVEDSWAFLNGRVAGGGNSAGDGNGFKLGGEPDGAGQGHAAHRLTRVAAFENRNCGFTRNNNDQSPVLMTCAVADNGNDYCDDLAECTPESSVSVSGDAAKMLPRNADGTLPSID
jgi:pectate disaccharide-lyase